MLLLQLPRDSLSNQTVITGTGKTEVLMGWNEKGTKGRTSQYRSTTDEADLQLLFFFQ